MLCLEQKAYSQLSQFLDLIGKLLPCDPLDIAQFLLDIMGMIPVLGEPADLINAMISLARGRYGDAALAAAAAVPWGGWMATGMKWTGKYGDELYDAIKYANKHGDDITECPLRNSFSANTLVVTKQGSKPISLVQEEDQVLAYDEETGESGYYTVTATVFHNDPIVVEVTINGETIRTTLDHPFYVVDSAPWLVVGEMAGRWVMAGELQVGDRIRNAEGTSGVVSEVSVLVDAEVMYNLTVAEAHTFAVGDGQWLVHNGDCLSPNQMSRAIRSGKAPTGKVNMERVDVGKIPGEQTHVHFEDGSALNMDGTWKHLPKSGSPPTLSSGQREWLGNNGWILPAK